MSSANLLMFLFGLLCRRIGSFRGSCCRRFIRSGHFADLGFEGFDLLVFLVGMDDSDWQSFAGCRQKSSGVRWNDEIRAS